MMSATTSSTNSQNVSIKRWLHFSKRSEPQPESKYSMTPSTNVQADHSMPLRQALLENAAFSSITGLIMLSAAEALTFVLGLRQPGTLRFIGAFLVAHAVMLGLNARRATIRRAEVWLAVALDLGWVFASAVMIAADKFSATGDWLVGLVAVVVFVFAFLQLLGLRRFCK